MKKIDLHHLWSVNPEKYRKLPFVDRLRLDPVKNNHPNWYKQLKREVDNTEGFTLKMCPSTTNFLNKGFVIKNPTDIFVKAEESGEIKIHTHIENNAHMQIHPREQFGEGYPFEDGFIDVSFKFSSFWQIKVDQPTSLCFCRVGGTRVTTILGLIMV